MFACCSLGYLRTPKGKSYQVKYAGITRERAPGHCLLQTKLCPPSHHPCPGSRETEIRSPLRTGLVTLGLSDGWSRWVLELSSPLGTLPSAPTGLGASCPRERPASTWGCRGACPCPGRIVVCWTRWCSRGVCSVCCSLQVLPSR